MIIKKYNIKLTRLSENDIELLRVKRNSKEIRERMVYQEEISQEEQKKWFDSIDNIYNLYLLIHFEGEVIGIINGKNADFKTKTSEGGIFIWDEKHINTLIPSLCSVIMHDYNFYVCEFEKTFIKVLKNNSAAIKFNKMFGYEILDENTPNDYYDCVLTRDRYINRIEKYRKAIANMYQDYGELIIEDFSFSNVSDEDLIRLYTPLPNYLKEKLNSVLAHENRITL